MDVLAISIHAPREGSDRRRRCHLPFLRISIHAPREGSDQPKSQAQIPAIDFNPRSP